MKKKLVERENEQEKIFGWRFIGKSVCGTSHERLDIPLQDANNYEKPSAEIIMMAVADGAGSALRSDEGASIAVKEAIKCLQESYDKFLDAEDDEDIKSFLLDAVNKAKSAVEKCAEESNDELSAFASTLLLTFATDNFVAMAQIGDGGIVIQDFEGKIIGLTIPILSTYANETHFLTSPDSPEYTQFRLWNGKAKHISMFSDGIEHLCLQIPEGAPYDNFFKPLFKFLDSSKDKDILEEELTDFLISPRMRENTDDDISLIMSSFIKDK